MHSLVSVSYTHLAVGAKNRGYNVKIIRNAINPNDDSIINKIESKNIKVISSLKDNR